jgi:hypothetical protein
LFQPLFYFYKSYTTQPWISQMRVVQAHNNVPFYQNLNKQGKQANPTYYLASNLNSVTKKD